MVWAPQQAAAVLRIPGTQVPVFVDQSKASELIQQSSARELEADWAATVETWVAVLEVSVLGWHSDLGTSVLGCLGYQPVP